MNNPNNQTGQDQANEAALASNLRKKNFDFRAVRQDAADDKYAKTLADFTASNISYEVGEVSDAKSGQAIATIKRNTLVAALPIIAITSLSQATQQSIADDLVDSAVRKAFIDKGVEIDVSLITPEFVEAALASQRTAAISADSLKQFAALVHKVLTSDGRNTDTVSTVTTMIKGRCTKSTLAPFHVYKEQLPQLLGLALAAIGKQSAEVQAEVDPIMQMLVTNLKAHMVAPEVAAMSFDL